MSRQQKYASSSNLRRASPAARPSTKFPANAVCGPAFTSFRQSFRRRKSIPTATQSYICQCCYVPAGGYKHIDVLVTGEPGSCRLPESWLGANGGALFLWERLPERQRRPARGRQLPESTLKDAPPVLPGAIWLNSSKIAERDVLAETEKVLPREPLTAYERDTFSTTSPTNCNLSNVLAVFLSFFKKGVDK